MAVFMLECDAVTEVGSSITSLVSKISDISSSVSGYDTSCEDGFDFASAKSAIASNIEACSSKVQNTAQLIENVVSSHTALQGSLKFDGSSGSSGASVGGSSSSGFSTSGSSSTSGGQTSGSSNNVNSEHSTTTNNSQKARSSSTTSSSTRTSGSSNGGVSGSTSGSSGGSAGGSGGGYSIGSNSINSPTVGSASSRTASNSVAGATVISGATAVAGSASKGNSSKGSESKKTNTTTTKSENRSETNTEISTVNHIKAGSTTNSIIDNIKYNKDGYGFIGSKHVISCDKSLGKIGDVITIKQPDGTKVECVIGKITNNKSAIGFYVNDSNFNSNKIINNITKGKVKIINKGQISSSVVSRTKILSNNKKIEVLGEERTDV